MNERTLSFTNEFFQSKTSKYIKDDDFFALFFIDMSEVEYALKLAVEIIEAFEEKSLYFASKEKIIKKTKTNDNKTLGMNIAKLREYEFKKIDNVDFKKLIHNLESFNEIRRKVVHHLFLQTDLKKFDSELKKGVNLARSITHELHIICKNIFVLMINMPKI